MWSLVVVEVDPVADRAHGVGQAFEPMAMHALLFQRADHPLDHAVLLRAMRRDELLLQAIAANQAGVFTTGKNQAVVLSPPLVSSTNNLSFPAFFVG